MVLQMLDVEGAGEVGMKLVPLFRKDVRSCGRVSLVKLCTLFIVFSFSFSAELREDLCSLVWCSSMMVVLVKCGLIREWKR